MTQTDVSDLAPAVSRIKIEGPGGPALDRSGRVELTEETLTRVLPGELDAAVGSQPQPEPDEEEGEGGDEDGEGDEEGPEDAAIVIDLDAPDADAQIESAAREAVRRANPDALFDPHVYDQTPVLDGQASDLLKIGVGGGVTLEASDADAQALFTALRLGKFVSIRAEGFVAAKAGGYAENKDGESKVTGKATIKITELRLLRPEELA